MLDPKVRELIAIGSSVAAKCQPCLDHHLEEAQRAGASASEVRHAIGIARMVRKASDENMDTFTDEKVGGRAPEPRKPSACCGSDGRGRRLGSGKPPAPTGRPRAEESGHDRTPDRHSAAARVQSRAD